MTNYITINPFKRYAKSAHDEAVALGIVRDVAKSTGMTAATVSRTFAGEVKRPNKDVVAALDAWLKENGFPLGDPNGRPIAKDFIKELRSKAQEAS